MKKDVDLSSSAFDVGALVDLISSLLETNELSMTDEEAVGMVYSIVSWLAENFDDVKILLEEQGNTDERLRLISRLNDFTEMYNRLMGLQTEKPFNTAIQNQLVEIMNKIIRGQYVSNEEMMFYCRYSRGLADVDLFENTFNYRQFLTSEERAVADRLDSFDEAINVISNIGVTVRVEDFLNGNHHYLLDCYANRLNEEYRMWVNRNCATTSAIADRLNGNAFRNREFTSIIDKLNEEFIEKITKLKQRYIEANSEVYDRIQFAKKRYQRLREIFEKERDRQLDGDAVLSEEEKQKLIQQMREVINQLKERVDTNSQQSTTGIKKVLEWLKKFMRANNIDSENFTGAMGLLLVGTAGAVVGLLENAPEMLENISGLLEGPATEALLGGVSGLLEAGL